MSADKTPIPEPTPPPAVDPAAQGSRETPDPAADLKPGGLLDQVLEKSRLSTRGSADALHRELTDDVKKMREAYASPRYYLTQLSDLPRDEVPRWLVNHHGQQYRTDAVLRFCLGRRWRIEDKDGALRDAALETYQERVEDYDQVLGDLIPDDFRREGHGIAAEARFDKGTNRTSAEDWPVYRWRLKWRSTRSLLGLSTGLPSLDSALRGLRGLTFLGGGTGVGKSTLALFIAAHALRKHPDLGVLFYSLDMPKTVLYDRLLSQEAGVEYGNLVADNPAQELQQQLDAADRRLRSEVLPRLRITEQLHPGKDQTLFQVMRDDVLRLLDSAAVNEVLVVVDYFQLLPVPDSVAPGLDADFYRVSALQSVQEGSRTNEHPAGFPILAISEVRKGESGRTEISVGDLMGSARLGYSAESVLLLEPAKDGAEGPVVPVHLKVAKARDGAVRTQIDLLFEHTRSRFREAPRSRTPKKGSKPKSDTAAPAPDQPKPDPFAGLEG